MATEVPQGASSQTQLSVQILDFILITYSPTISATFSRLCCDSSQTNLCIPDVSVSGIVYGMSSQPH